MSTKFASFFYLISAILFILSIGGLSSAKTARKGNLYGICGMALAIITTLMLPSVEHYKFIICAFVIGGCIGYIIAKKIAMTALPQLVAAFHSLVGLSAVFIAIAAMLAPEAFGITDGISVWRSLEMSLGTAIGAITFTGSIIAFSKLQGIVKGNPLDFALKNKVNLGIGALIILLILIFTFTNYHTLMYIITILSCVLGILLIMPVGGADMPVIVSMLNSYSGWAAAGIGFTLQNDLLVITGAIVGTSGAILSNIMCKGMNRSLLNVVFGGINSENSAQTISNKNNTNVKLCSEEDAAFILKNASSVIIVPGYGMAVAQAQHAIKELVDALKKDDISVKFAIHPVAGRMPGHMNVLLAEANIDYDDVLEIDEINHEFAATDVAIVIGANDITNPAAKNDPTSPIYGMPILEVEKARTVLCIKRSLGAGYAGIDNALFYMDNTMMILGDAKKVSENILKAINAL